MKSVKTNLGRGVPPIWVIVSSPSETLPTPQLTPPSNNPSDHISDLYISWEILNINIIRNELVEIYTITHRRDSCMKGVWEVLDEGVGVV